VLEEIVIRPVGVVKSDLLDHKKAPDSEPKAVVEVFPEYAGALKQLEKNSHLWILTWFHLARRNVLAATPYRINPNSPSYGVFALRTPVRPNPVGLNLVQLDRVAGLELYVTGLDAVNETPVIDIKPYYENDIVFSPRTPHIYSLKRKMQRSLLLKQALTHHQEECAGLLLAVRMALIAEERLGQLNSPDLYVMVEGSPCLADTIQGLSRARLANPPRFEYRPADWPGRTIWRLGSKVLSITARRQIDKGAFSETDDNEILDISMQTP
jgi:tRNA-Thr(GGU) m(6)t(6)A37 methyltransferase TsaA